MGKISKMYGKQGFNKIQFFIKNWTLVHNEPLNIKV